MLVVASLEIPCISQSAIQLNEEDVVKGGNADVFRGELSVDGKPFPIPVAIKRVRIRIYGEATRSLVEKAQRDLIRELRIWSSLQKLSAPHPNLLPLLGVMETSSGLLESVSEYCMGTLASYLLSPSVGLKRIQLVCNYFGHTCTHKQHLVQMLDTLKGLTHMHGLSIIHGDLKSVNVLVTEGGIAKICDFGHSRYAEDIHQDQFGASDASSSFQATPRYMCPEFFRSKKARPTVFSDMWAFGCLALEILSQLQPYHTIKNDYDVPNAIQSGVVPSVKPEYPNAAGCLNDVLWGVVKQCWVTNPSSRPSSNAMLESIYNLMARGLINPSAATPERPGLVMDDELVPLPPGVKDFASESPGLRKELALGGKTVNIWA
ncbi:hypothetical protein FRC12_017860 [Ceratobasidium sp. 428]|nr:hypothetical protein FRC12_017860 [Ceratobasidium sp. 428]